MTGLDLQCCEHTDRGRCRNKVAAHVPSGRFTRALCRKHVDRWAVNKLDEHRELVFALEWTKRMVAASTEPAK